MRIMEVEEWRVVFYVDDQGRSPVAEFLERLDLKTKARFDWSIEQLRSRNTGARAVSSSPGRQDLGATARER